MDCPFKQGLTDLDDNATAVVNRTIIGIQTSYFKKIKF